MPDHAFDDGFIALAYEGARIGSWWPRRPNLSGISDSAVVIETASMLKWVHAPIVSPDWQDDVQSFAQQYPAQTLRAWLLDDDLPAGLEYGATEEQWSAAVPPNILRLDPKQYSAWEISRPGFWHLRMIQSRKLCKPCCMRTRF